MEKARVKIVGVRPLLMHNPDAMEAGKGNRRTIPTPEVEAAASCYWLPDHSSLGVPSRCVHSSILKASAPFRITARQSVKPLIDGCLEVQPEMIPLGTVEYEVDVQRAVVQKQGIRRARAKVWPWALTFEVLYDPEWLTTKFMRESFPDILKRAGGAVGLLDFRPRYGRFVVEEYEA